MFKMGLSFRLQKVMFTFHVIEKIIFVDALVTQGAHTP